MSEQETLIFPDHRVDGAYPVTDGDGTVVARVGAAWSGGRFSASGADGTPLCDGAASRWWPSGRWRVTGPDGAPLLTLTARTLRNTAVVEPARGGELTVRGSAWRRDFAVLDEDGRTVVTATPRTRAMSPHQHDYAVRQPGPGRLAPAEVIAIVQAWRMVKKADAAVLAATTATAATPSA